MGGVISGQVGQQSSKEQMDRRMKRVEVKGEREEGRVKDV